LLAEAAAAEEARGVDPRTRRDDLIAQVTQAANEKAAAKAEAEAEAPAEEEPEVEEAEA